MPTLDVREIPPVDRHPKIHSTFEEMEPGETLTIINDHEPKPLYYEMAAEVPEFDEENYTVEEAKQGKFVATFPKQAADGGVTRTNIEKLEGEPHANAFPGETPKTIRLSLADGESVPAHDHPDSEIVFYLREGAIDLRLGDRTHALKAGDILRFDGDRTVEPTAREDSTALIVLAPRQPEA